MITPHKMYFSVKEYYLQNKTLDISSFHLEAFLIEWNKEAELWTSAVKKYATI